MNDVSASIQRRQAEVHNLILRATFICEKMTPWYYTTGADFSIYGDADKKASIVFNLHIIFLLTTMLLGQISKPL